jgi:hypothetical protein
MNRPATRQAVWQLAGWAFPILVGLLLAPPARAGCGDYVTTRLSASDHAAGQQPPMAPAPHRPCHGPHCSQAPAEPSAPAPTPPPQSSQEWGCVLDDFASVPPDPIALLPRKQDPSPIRFLSDIFHPPRLAS